MKQVLPVATVLVALAVSLGAAGQGRGGQPPGPPPTAQAIAPVDLTGYWVSIVSEDWRWRMVRPAKGDYSSVPLNPEGRKVADGWDPAAAEAAGEACKAYGAPAILRVPGRLHITWQDENTLKVETDAGMQTRLLRFGAQDAPRGERTWQGESAAEWEVPGRGRGRGGRGAAPVRAEFGHLKVVTSNLRPGYLRKNGVPYSEDAVLTEYWDVIRDHAGQDWLVITTVVDDPRYLQTQWVTSLNFKPEPDGAKWDPSPCSTK